MFLFFFTKPTTRKLRLRFFLPVAQLVSAPLTTVGSITFADNIAFAGKTARDVNVVELRNEITAS